MSGRTSRNKGAQAERDVVHHLNRNGWPHAERRLGGRDNDTGDITGIPGVVLEVKDHKSLSLGAWVDQLADEKRRARAGDGAVVVKRKGTADRAGEWFAVMSLDDYMGVLERLGHR